MPTDAQIQQCAERAHWWGEGDNCLRSSVEELRANEAVCLAAVPLAVIEDGPAGPMEVVAFIHGGRRVAWRLPGGTRLHFAGVSVGGLSQPVATTLLGGGPSRFVHGLYHGGALCLTEDDAARFGAAEAPRVRRDAPDVEALFGANVTQSEPYLNHFGGSS